MTAKRVWVSADVMDDADGHQYALCDREKPMRLPDSRAIDPANLDPAMVERVKRFLMLNYPPSARSKDDPMTEEAYWHEARGLLVAALTVEGDDG